ncbi:MAG: hypothetical protein ACK54R_03750, partial [Pirellulaceae bacterium]
MLGPFTFQRTSGAGPPAYCGEPAVATSLYYPPTSPDRPPQSLAGGDGFDSFRCPWLCGGQKDNLPEYTEGGQAGWLLDPRGAPPALSQQDLLKGAPLM